VGFAGGQGLEQNRNALFYTARETEFDPATQLSCRLSGTNVATPSERRNTLRTYPKTLNRTSAAGRWPQLLGSEPRLTPIG